MPAVSSYRELELLDRVRVIVALGAFGYEAVWAMLRAGDGADSSCRRAGPGSRTGSKSPCGRVTVVGAFHPSQQNTFTGRLTPPMLDAVFARAPRTLRSSSAMISPTA